ncbi:MAG: 50S ribosomal protein L23 [Salinisphaera sp.]|nr:50S ribosomal protein L23 [Salinisphaera sp.]MDN5939136.1 50S ribosomal protein L23 [Salinisphaera sp.]
MNQERAFTVLRQPHVSEKSTIVGDKHNQIVFKVARDANKAEIKQAVQTLFKVKVTGVTTLNMAGKRTSFRGGRGRRPAWKKAYVTLAEGEAIDFTGGVE